MSPQPSLHVECLIFYQSHFVPSSLSLSEEGGLHLQCVPSELVLASLCLKAIGWLWSCDLRSNNHCKEADQTVYAVGI